MLLHFSKYQGAGNDFIIIDNRTSSISLSTQKIEKLCNRNFGIGADGLMFLELSEQANFKMIYFNADGKESTMCGNGGRCIVAFANRLNIINHKTKFIAIDGIHHAEILANNKVRLQMQNVETIKQINENTYILNTGSPHYVMFYQGINQLNVLEEGRKIRNTEPYKASGINVNFIEKIDADKLQIRTYERGVENETLACGTGVTAAAIALAEAEGKKSGNIFVEAKGGNLEVEFNKEGNIYQNIWLTGLAEFVFEGKIEI